jgi:hypothetical protein
VDDVLGACHTSKGSRLDGGRARNRQTW